MIDIQDLATSYYIPSTQKLDQNYHILSFVDNTDNHFIEMNINKQQLKQLKENVNRLYHTLLKLEQKRI
jgi:hypothetical protein